VIPLCLEASGSVRARSIIQSAACAMLVHTFWPLTTKWSPSRTARHWSDARSLPALGSEYPWHQISSQERILER